MRRRLEDRPLVVGQHLQPRLQIGRMIRPRLELRRDAEIGAEEATAELGDQFFARAFGPVLRVAERSRPTRCSARRPVRRLMAERRHIAGRIAKRLEGRHLDVVHDRRIVGLVAAVSDHGAGVAEEAIGMLDPLDRIADLAPAAHNSCRADRRSARR